MAAAIAIAVDGACCPATLPVAKGEDKDPPAVGVGEEEDGRTAVTPAAADVPPLLPPPPPPTFSIFDEPLVSTGIIAVSGNKLSPGPPGGAAASGKWVPSPELLIPGSLGNGA